MRDVITVILLGSGLSFMLIGAWGVVRLPDAYHRLHASSKCSTLGLFGMLAGAVVHIGTADALIKAALTLLFTVVATPVGSHVLAKAAHSRDSDSGTTRCPTSWPTTSGTAPRRSRDGPARRRHPRSTISVNQRSQGGVDVSRTGQGTRSDTQTPTDRRVDTPINGAGPSGRGHHASHRRCS